MPTMLHVGRVRTVRWLMPAGATWLARDEPG